ncbi:protein phosphatase 1 regulatory subunit 15A [Gouania willdenowi]|uniref:Protein phosphatase 1 regulatory subunit 15A-like n=1 Tax=Gouania willdenowi TaxID=441366 RepID=A0A8C5E4J6_GOUWI|nr:protein phosphatase 1 regulatory subunit 15A-like [Gouania willdenowi]
MKGVNMETVAASQRTAVESFGSGGMALLPWTKQMLTVLWEQLRLLLQVIYYSFVSVFQMFRFEVHVRITDETGQHIQHMATATNSTESFLFSSLFERDSSSSNFCADVSDPFTGKSTAEALLSSLRAEDLCCGLVDDFVSRTAATEEGIFLGHHSSWKMGFPHDWNIFVSSGESSGSSDSCHQDSEKLFQRCTTQEKLFKQDTTEEERSCHWSSEEDQNIVEFDSEESKALWESLSKSTDPYNPFFFSACISTTTHMRKNKSDVKDCTDTGIMSINKACEEMLGPQGLNIWVSRSDSECSWTSSDGSSPDIDREENERLWDFFSSPSDPYNPMCFSASTVSSTIPAVAKKQASLPAPPSESTSDTEEEEESISCPASSEDEEEDQLWKSLSRTNDPYHPLNFQAHLRTSPNTPSHQKQVPHTPVVKRPKASQKPRAAKARQRRHIHPEKTFLPWRKPLKKDPEAPEPERPNRADCTHKQVRFSPHVHVHVMRTWRFARQASRKGPWEEMARDRDRFQKRIKEAERVLGPCFSPAHRAEVWARLQRGALN